jgi:hypothetical protein
MKTAVEEYQGNEGLGQGYLVPEKQHVNRQPEEERDINSFQAIFVKPHDIQRSFDLVYLGQHIPGDEQEDRDHETERLPEEDPKVVGYGERRGDMGRFYPPFENQEGRDVPQDDKDDEDTSGDIQTYVMIRVHRIHLVAWPTQPVSIALSRPVRLGTGKEYPFTQ